MEEELINQWLLTNSSNLEALIEEQRASKYYSPKQEDNISYPIGEYNACLKSKKVWAEIANEIGVERALNLSEEGYYDLTKK